MVWSSSLTVDEQFSLERTQKIALRIIYQKDYICYENALKISKLPTIIQRYHDLLLRFAIKCSKNDKTSDMLPLVTIHKKTRKPEKFEVPLARKERLYKSAIPTMTRILNDFYDKS